MYNAIDWSEHRTRPRRCVVRPPYGRRRGHRADCCGLFVFMFPPYVCGASTLFSRTEGSCTEAMRACIPAYDMKRARYMCPSYARASVYSNDVTVDRPCHVLYLSHHIQTMCARHRRCSNSHAMLPCQLGSAPTSRCVCISVSLSVCV